MDRDFYGNVYLHLTLWVWLTAVITFKDSPGTLDSHVSLEISSFDCHVTIIVRTWHKLTRAGFQVNLYVTHTQT